MSNWIFVIKNSDKEFHSRVKNKEWPIYNKTQNRKRLQIGDRLIFYKAGTDGQKFLGIATIGSNLKEKSSFTSSLDLNDIKIWKTPVEMKNAIKNLDFIKNKENWGNYFQGGVRRISDTDFDTITKGA